MRTLNTDQIKRWFHRPRQSHLPRESSMEWYFTFHPRTSFLKTLPQDSEVVDVGAGDGTLSTFRDWPAPARKDLRLFAYALDMGVHFDKFDGYEIGDWNVAPPDFGGRTFDAIVCAHFVEHIADPVSLIRWAAHKLRPGGRMYLEWPSPASLSLPSRAELDTADGVPLMISRFQDDCTHRDLPQRQVMIDGARASGLVVDTEGTISLPWLEDEMLAQFAHHEDGFARQAAFWSRTMWSQYLIIRQPDEAVQNAAESQS